MEFKVSKELFTSLSCGMEQFFCPNPHDPNDFSLHWEKRHQAASFRQQLKQNTVNNKKDRTAHSQAQSGKPPTNTDGDENRNKLDKDTQEWSNLFDFLSDTFNFGYFMKVPYHLKEATDIIFELEFRLSKNLVDIIGRIKLSTFGRWSYYVRYDENIHSHGDLDKELQDLIQSIMNYEHDHNHDIAMPDINHMIDISLQRTPCKLKYNGECILTTQDGEALNVAYKRQLNVVRFEDRSLKVIMQEYTFLMNVDKIIPDHENINYTKLVLDQLAYDLNYESNKLRFDSYKPIDPKLFEEHIVTLAEIHRRKKEFLIDACNALSASTCYLSKYLYGRNASLAMRKCDQYYFLNVTCSILLSNANVFQFAFRRDIGKDGSVPSTARRSKAMTYKFSPKHKLNHVTSLSDFEVVVYIDQRYGNKSINNNVGFGIKLPLTTAMQTDSTSSDISSCCVIECGLNCALSSVASTLERLLVSAVQSSSLEWSDQLQHQHLVVSQTLSFQTTPILSYDNQGYITPLKLLDDFEVSVRQSVQGIMSVTSNELVDTTNGEVTMGDSAYIEYARTKYNRSPKNSLSYKQLENALKSVDPNSTKKADAELALFYISLREEDEIKALINSACLGNTEARERLACGYFFNYNLRSRSDMDAASILNILQDYPRFEIGICDSRRDSGAYGAIYTAKVIKEDVNYRPWNSPESIIDQTVIAKELFDPNSTKLQTEATYMLLLRSSPFIVKCFGLAKKTSNKECVIMEVADCGNLRAVLNYLHNQFNPWNDVCVRIKLHWMLDIARGLHDLHHFHIKHLDLHSKNVLLFSKTNTQCVGFKSTIPRAKLADFGLSRRQAGYDNNVETSETSTLVGDFNQPFRARDTVKTIKYDIFMFGKICLEMLNIDYTKLLQKLENKNNTELEKELILFVKSLVEPDMEKRLNATDCVIILTRLIKKYPLEEDIPTLDWRGNWREVA